MIRSASPLLLLPFVFPLLLPGAPSRGQESRASAPAAAPTATTAPARVPIFPNSTCPIMGKPISERLYAETPKGRIYICCKSCIKDILADVETAYRAAFPKDVVHENKNCPVTGTEVGKEPVVVVLQGHRFRVRDEQAAAFARENSQVVLAKLLDPKLVDLANEVCPVAGTPVVKNTVVVIDGHLIRLSSPKVLEEVERDPAKVLAKAKLLRAQPAAPAK